MNPGDSIVVYLLNPTSNHNPCVAVIVREPVVYLLNPTSNHNNWTTFSKSLALYIFWILHQTTTYQVKGCFRNCCISFESYIKPQPACNVDYLPQVVYLLNPTSNHNPSALLACIRMLYIFWILHQTTTLMWFHPYSARLYIFWILHQTTTPRCNY